MDDESRRTRIVVYLRCRPADQSASDSAMEEQRAILAAWLAAEATAPDTLREFIEEETDEAGRPALASAIAFCKVQGATLVIVSKAAIGVGPPFDPRIASVPVIVVPQPKRPIPPVIPLPAKSGKEVSLFVGAVHDGRIPVYLCNPKPVALTDVTVSMGGLYTAVCHDESMIPFGARPETFARIEPFTAQLIESRSVMMEGESIDQRRIRFEEDGEIREGVVYLSKLFDPKFVALTFAAVPKPKNSP